MIVREFERLLVEHGASATTLDLLTRHLRAMNLLPVGGRGLNAPPISPSDAARIMICLAAVDVPANAPPTISRVIALQQEQTGAGSPILLVDSLAEILSSGAVPSDLLEVRVCRTGAFARIVRADGSSEKYFSSRPTDMRMVELRQRGFTVEGVLSAGLLRAASEALTRTACHS